MTREDLVDWLKEQGCDQVPIEGVNISGRAIKFLNKKTNRHSYVDTPIDDRQIPDFVVAHLCEQLLIKSPDCVAEQTPLVKSIKDRFSPRVRNGKK